MAHHESKSSTTEPSTTTTTTTTTTKTGTETDTAATNPRGIPIAPFLDNISHYIISRSDVEPTLLRFQEMIQKYQFMEVNTTRRAQGLREKIPDIARTLETVRFLSQQRQRRLRRRRRHGHRPGLRSASKRTDPDPDADSDLDTDTKEQGEEEEEKEEEEEEEAGEGGEKTRRFLETTFSLNDTLYARAEIDPDTLDEVYLWLGANVMLAYPLAEAETMLREKLSAAERGLGNCEEDLEFLRDQITTLEVSTARVYNWDVVQKRKEKDEEEGHGQGQGQGKSQGQGKGKGGGSGGEDT